MNIANVRSRFAVLAGIEEAELSRYETLIGDACDYVQSRCKVDDPDSGQTKRLEMLAAAYALKLYGACTEDGLSQFVAGDVRLTLSAGKDGIGEKRWRELAAENADLIDFGGFIFGRVI